MWVLKIISCGLLSILLIKVCNWIVQVIKKGKFLKKQKDVYLKRFKKIIMKYKLYSLLYRLLKRLGFDYEEYTIHVLRKCVKIFFYKNRDHKYLFILSPPYCGSTLLNEIISTSDNVSVNNRYGTREGQTLPSVRKIMFEGINRWNPEIEFDWNFIKMEWMKYWDLSKPILLDKSPANIVRAQAVSRAFDPSFFIIFYRNPYAHCESLMRRNGWSPVRSANFAIDSLRFQKVNIENLGNYIKFSYESLT